MNAMDGPDGIGNVVGALAAIGGLASAAVAIWARRDAKASAQASAESADAANKLSQLEHDRHHDDLRPAPPAEIRAQVVENPLVGAGHSSLMGSITLSHDYRVWITAIMDHNASAPIGFFVVRANQPQSFQIEQWSQDKTEPAVKKIKFRFWPPIEGDEADSWSCRCGRPTEAGEAAPGHWEWTVPVAFNPPDLRFFD